MFPGKKRSNKIKYSNFPALEPTTIQQILINSSKPLTLLMSPTLIDTI